MKFQEVKELIKLIDSTKMNYINLEIDNLKLEMSKESSYDLHKKVKNDVNLLKQNNSDDAKDLEVIYDIENNEAILGNENSKYNLEYEHNTNESSNDEDLFIMKSPIMGTFYQSPTPDSDVFVKVGDIVKNGQTLCILEAMKLMNEIQSTVNGEIIEIMVNNEELVEFDQPIFKIKIND
jgi:acetyl-CoA carboxylase biotin carboxyl carrier protein